MVENAIYRYKTILGRGMRSRGLEGATGGSAARVQNPQPNGLARNARQLPSGQIPPEDGGSAYDSEPCTNALCRERSLERQYWIDLGNDKMRTEPLVKRNVYDRLPSNAKPFYRHWVES